MANLPNQGPRRFSEAVGFVRGEFPSHIMDMYQMPSLNDDFGDVPPFLVSRYRDMDPGEFLCMIFMFRIFDDYFPELWDRMYRTPIQ